MGQLLSTEFWSQQWAYIIGNAGAMIPLVIISMAIGWWLRGMAVRSEIAGLERVNEALEQRFTLAREQETALTKVSGDSDCGSECHSQRKTDSASKIRQYPTQ